MVQSFAELIDTVTVPVAAEAMGVVESHVRTMKARDSISPDHWPALLRLSEERDLGLSEGRLLGMRKRRRSPEVSL